MPNRHFLNGVFRSNTWLQLGGNQKKLFKAILIFHAIICVWFIWRNDIMSDETGYFSYAVRWAQGNADRIEPTDDSKSPMVAPALAPVLLKPLFSHYNDPHGFLLLRIGRTFMYGYMLLAAFFLLLWLVRIVGHQQWWLPLLLFLFDPLVLSHAMVVGTDVASMALLLAMVYSAMRYTSTGSFHYWLWCSVFTALALITKSSMVMSVLIPLSALVMVVVQRGTSAKTRFTDAWRNLALLVALIWLLINAAYYFEGSFSPIAQLPQRSMLFQQLQQLLQPIAHWPALLPTHYLSSFDQLAFHAELGGGPNHENTYVGINVLNQLQTQGSVWYYYLVAFMVKWPLLIWALFAMTLVLGLKKINSSKLLRWTWLWLPPLFFLVMMSLRNPFQIGIRHALLLYPFLYLFIAQSLLLLWNRKKRLTTIVLVLHTISLASFWPNMIAYSNELFWPKASIYRYINDSSISYGNTQHWVEKFVAANPEYQIPDSLPRAGKFAVAMERLTSPWNTWGLDWLGKNFAPTGLYMHTVVLFDISEKDLQQAAVKVQ